MVESFQCVSIHLWETKSYKCKWCEALIAPGYNLFEGGLTPEFRDLPYLFQDKYIRYLVSLRKTIRYSTKVDWIQFSGHSSVDTMYYHSSVDTMYYQSSELANGFDWYDILQQDYRGKSVFLNSCETGVGIYQPGEGLMSLGTAFLLSGANQVVETRWKYPEAPAQEIGRLFYRHSGHRNPARALHRAINDYLKDCPPGADYPHYWAGISVQGYDYSRSGSPIFLIVFLFLTIILVVLIKNLINSKPGVQVDCLKIVAFSD